LGTSPGSALMSQEEYLLSRSGIFGPCLNIKAITRSPRALWAEEGDNNE
jgi:hypothetical protein